MPVVRLVNPHLFGGQRRRKNAERHGKLSDKIADVVKNSLHTELHHLQHEKSLGVESNPLVNSGGWKGNQTMKKHHRKHRHNPHVRHHRYRRSRRNPIMGMSTSELLKSLAFAAAGNIAADAVPSALGMTSGVMGYAAKAGTALAASYIAGKIAGSAAATSTLIGGGLAVLRQVLNDFFPGTVLANGMSGDLAFYINNGFPVPTAGSGPYLLNPGYSGSLPQMNGGLPAAAAPAVVASNGQPATAAGTPAALPASTSGGDGGAWRGGGRWAS